MRDSLIILTDLRNKVAILPLWWSCIEHFDNGHDTKMLSLCWIKGVWDGSRNDGVHLQHWVDGSVRAI